MPVNGLRYLLLVLLLAGCASSAKLRVESPVTPGLSGYDRVFVNVQGARPAIEKKHGYDVTSAALEKGFIQSLAQSKKFKKISSEVSGNPEYNAVLVVLKIEAFDYVSGASSVMMGVMSGNASLRVSAELRDMKEDKLLGELVSSAQTRTSHGIFRGSTGTLAADVSKQLADAVASYK